MDMALINLLTDVRRISPEDKQCFFGYYDLQAYDETDRYHLYGETAFIDRTPEVGDGIVLGYIDTVTGKTAEFAKSNLWNFQQGCMLQWYGKDTVCYNIYENDKTRNPFAVGNMCVHNLLTGEKRYTDRPCAAVSPDGRYGLSVNFGRIYDFRTGYGYVMTPDKNKHINCPCDDGIFLVDMTTGKSRLIINYRDCLKMLDLKGMENAKFVVNHITFNTASNRFLFLLRNFPADGLDWYTTLITSDLNGNMNVIFANTYVSHYFWKNEKQILAHCTPKDKKGLFLIDDISNDFTELASPFFTDDIHCIYSPDRRYIIGDGYAIHDEYRPLFIYNPETERTEYLLKAETIVPDDINIRCDLHARWNRKGDKISFDTTDRGRREICELNMKGVNI